MEDTPEDSSSFTGASTNQLTATGPWEAAAGWLWLLWAGGLSITSYMGSRLHRFFCGCGRLLARQKAACPDWCQPRHCALHSVREQDDKEEHGFSASSRCQRNSARERTRSRSLQWGNNLRSWFVHTMDYDHSARRTRRTSLPSRDHAPNDNPVPGCSSGSSQYSPAPRDAREQTLVRKRERSRSPRRGYSLRSRFVEYKEYAPSARRRRTTSPPSYDHAPSDNATPGTSNSSSQNPAPSATWEQTLLRQREIRSPRCSYDLCSQLGEHREYHQSSKRRRTSPPRHRHAPRIDTTQGLSNSFSESPLAPRTAQEQTLLRQTERSRSPQRGYDPHSWLVEYTEYHHSARRRRSISVHYRCS